MIGQPISRVDGPVKVTGRATYAYEYWHDEAPLYGVIVTATIGRGHIREIDLSQAQRSQGVYAFVTHQNAPAQGTRDEPSPMPLPYWSARPTLASSRIGHYGEPVALVVAATLEQAQAAANLVRIAYAAEPGHYDFTAEAEKAYAPKQLLFGMPTDSAVGNFNEGYDSAPVKIDHEYNTPYCFSQPMEPNACLAVPRGEDLELYVSTQIVDAVRSCVASTLKIDPQRIKVVSPYVGGGFGSKLSVHSETILAAIAARRLNRTATNLSRCRRAANVHPANPTRGGARRKARGHRSRCDHAHEPPGGVCRSERACNAQLLRGAPSTNAASIGSVRHAARRGRACSRRSTRPAGA
jgi:xanthine dehydrogenase YagR molybdenum-binding subunit